MNNEISNLLNICESYIHYVTLRYMNHDSNNHRYLISSIFISSIGDNLQANEFYEQKAKNKSVHLQF